MDKPWCFPPFFPTHACMNTHTHTYIYIYTHTSPRWQCGFTFKKSSTCWSHSGSPGRWKRSQRVEKLEALGIGEITWSSPPAHFFWFEVSPCFNRIFPTIATKIGLVGPQKWEDLPNFRMVSGGCFYGWGQELLRRTKICRFWGFSSFAGLWVWVSRNDTLTNMFPNTWVKQPTKIEAKNRNSLGPRDFKPCGHKNSKLLTPEWDG